jgi:hypothetical protein
MSLGTIEKLFVLRHNLLAMGDPRSIWATPLLYLMALLVWCLGIATIYPPGALIVTFEAHTFTEKQNMSVMNPTVPEDLKFYNIDNTFPTLAGPRLSYTKAGNDDPDYDDMQVTGVEFTYSYVVSLTLQA